MEGLNSQYHNWYWLFDFSNECDTVLMLLLKLNDRWRTSFTCARVKGNKNLTGFSPYINKAAFLIQPYALAYGTFPQAHV